MRHPSAIMWHLQAASSLWVADTGMLNMPPWGGSSQREICLRADFGSQIRLVGLTLCQLVLTGSLLHYLWLCCNKNHLCLILLPLEDHLWLPLLMAPRGSAGDLLETLISTSLMCGFSCSFLTPLWKDVSPTHSGGSRNTWDDGDGLRVFSFSLPERNTVL